MTVRDLGDVGPPAASIPSALVMSSPRRRELTLIFTCQVLLLACPEGRSLFSGEKEHARSGTRGIRLPWAPRVPGPLAFVQADESMVSVCSAAGRNEMLRAGVSSL